ncbi:MAG TPA: paraquat-inducible protein A [Kofleriaceae bacterium]|jgi:paraquat-inducible protein A
MAQTELAICTYCDAVHERSTLPESSTARCAYCNAVLYHTNPRIGGMLAVTVTAMIAFVIANSFPLITLTSGGYKIEATLWRAIIASYDQDIPAVAVALATTLIVAPLLELGLLLWVLVPLNLNTRPFGFRTAMRLMHILRPWRMVEVFLLGVLVALVKLGSLATAVPGWGVFGIGVITFSLASLGYFDRGELWRRVDAIATTAQGREVPAA